MRKMYLIFALLLSAVGFVTAQRTVTGMVTDAKGEVLIGANVLSKGTTTATVTDVEGKYSLRLAADASALVFSYVGYDAQEITLGASNVLDVKMVEGNVLTDVVVTALGVKRDKNELAYSAQKVRGEDVSKSRDGNVVNALSGKVAGLSVKRNNSMGGSTNIVLRGTKSLTGDNQALFVVDGVPIDNSNNNTDGQKSGRKGYDFGNAASDINGDDVADITVLKGAAATALYGSRAANGAVIITTKKGGNNKGLGVTLNLGANFGKVDKTTFASYQKKYGQGYGKYYEDASGLFLERDVDGDGKPDLVSPTSEDASWGAPFDPTKLVYQWDAFAPASDNFKKATPWVAAANDPSSFLQDAFGTNNGIAIDGSNDKGYFKLGFNHITDAGIMPNSSTKKNLVNFGAGYNLSPSIKLSSNINYTNMSATGRYGTGYDSKNLMTNFRQWWNVGVDIKSQEAVYLKNKENVTWNWADPSALSPIYWDNPYWTRFENYENDGRGRYFGNIAADIKLTSWLNLHGQVSLDKYNEYQEERIAVGSVDVSEYSRYDRSFEEKNYDLMLSTTPLKLANKFKFSALAGSNVRRTDGNSILDKTNGGLAIPRIYALANSANARNAPTEIVSKLQVNGLFAQTSFNYDDFLFVELSGRRDKASSLPTANNTYLYPAASLGMIFSKFIPENNFLSFGKIRANYAEVGNAAPTRIVNDTYLLGVNPLTEDASVFATSFNGVALASLSSIKNNANLKPERTKSLEFGLETRFFNNRAGLDFTYYKMNTVDQIVAAPVSRTTGYSFKYINAGDIENRGVELQLFAIPVKTRNFEWRTDLNWAANRNLVVSLGGEIDNLELASLQGGITINATVGQPYGTIRGSNFKYLDGQKIIGANGAYSSSSVSNEIIGNVNADWTGGWNNSIRYKNINLSFLIDVRKGGDLFSLDMYYGLATGLYPETATTNDKGNEVRSPIAKGGGVLLPGVKADGVKNDKYYDATNFGIYGYRRNPAAGFIYDASYVKLRELNLSYDFPKSWFKNAKIKGVNLGVFGRNLWILYKNTPYSDPEEGFSSGNVQGYQGGAYPALKVFGANLNVKF